MHLLVLYMETIKIILWMKKWKQNQKIFMLSQKFQMKIVQSYSQTYLVKNL